ncbi:MAG: WbqC family protein [Candidatus Dojkabacteria bacterium]|nr:WbqC family protein [Candidatus Dojkabacteria bacterium]
MKSVIITQSNYIPWKGYFDSMALVDEFILYDDVQYTRRDWRNRNLIKTPQGLKWLTIPIEVKGKFFQRIKDAKVSNNRWVKDHLKTIQFNYAKARYFKEVFPFLESIYLQAEKMEYLSEINFLFLQKIAQYLNICTPIRFCWEYPYNGNDTNMRIIQICQLAGATDYYSGPRAQNYIDVSLFEQNNLKVHWLDYNGYTEYEQLHPPFEHGVSIIDLLLNTGKESTRYLKYTNR